MDGNDKCTVLIGQALGRPPTMDEEAIGRCAEELAEACMRKELAKMRRLIDSYMKDAIPKKVKRFTDSFFDELRKAFLTGQLYGWTKAATKEEKQALIMAWWKGRKNDRR
jgi:hypothetical protein